MTDWLELEVLKVENARLNKLLDKIEGRITAAFATSSELRGLLLELVDATWHKIDGEGPRCSMCDQVLGKCASDCTLGPAADKVREYACAALKGEGETDD